MMNWWQNLARRERLTLIVGGVITALMLVYGLIWEPLHSAKAGLTAQNAELEADWQWMQAAAHVLKRAPQVQPGTVNRGSLLVDIDRSLRQSDLNTLEKRIEPRGSDKVSVDFPQVEFDALIRWLASLSNQYALQVNTLSLQRQQAGRVRARLLLQRD
jgi:general secretion pathway protein M